MSVAPSTGPRAPRGFYGHDALSANRQFLDLLPYAVVLADPGGAIIATNRIYDTTLAAPVAARTCCELFGCGRPGGPRQCLTAAALAAGGKKRARTVIGRHRADMLWIAASRAVSSDDVVFRLQPSAGEPAPQLDEELREKRKERLNILVLGPAQIVREGLPMRLSSDGEWLRQRPGQLLKFLVAMRGRVVSTEQIAEALWPRLGSAGPGTVRHTVHLLRRRLDPDPETADPYRFITTARGSYSLNPASVWIDADAFETAVRTGMDAYLNGDLPGAEAAFVQTLDLYRGDFLDDEPYAEWAFAERGRLRELLEVPLRGLAQIRLDRGDLGAAASFIEELAALEPYDNDVTRALIMIWLAQGRRGRAMRHYQQFVARLSREFGVDPGFDLSDLLREHPADIRLL